MPCCLDKQHRDLLSVRFRFDCIHSFVAPLLHVGCLPLSGSCFLDVLGLLVKWCVILRSGRCRIVCVTTYQMSYQITSLTHSLGTTTVGLTVTFSRASQTLLLDTCLGGDGWPFCGLSSTTKAEAPVISEDLHFDSPRAFACPTVYLRTEPQRST